MQEEISFGFSCESGVGAAAEALASAVETRLGGPREVAGAFLLATAASGSQAFEIGQRLGDRWPRAEVLGTSFEGLIAEGRVWRDLPAFALIAWRGGELAPFPFLVEADESDLERLADEFHEALPAPRASSRDLVLLFPDAEASPSVESRLPGGLGRSAPFDLAGAAASGPDGAPADAWVAGERVRGACLGLYLPGWGREQAPFAREAIGVAAGTRLASRWLEVTRSRPRWVDEIEGQPALHVLREALGVSPRDRLERYFDRLLVRFRGRGSTRGRSAAKPADPPSLSRASPWDSSSEEERYLVGLDPRKHAFSLPIDSMQGGQIAFAWPDATTARDALRKTFDALTPAPRHLQFACRTRDASLHGDADLEAAWLAAEAGHRPGASGTTGSVVGTVGPFQIASSGHPDTALPPQRLVHSTVLVSLRSPV